MQEVYLKNMRIAAEDVIAVLGCASGNCINVNAACQELKNSAFDESPARSISLRLARAHCMQRALNRIFRAQTPRFVKKENIHITLCST